MQALCRPTQPSYRGVWRETWRTLDARSGRAGYRSSRKLSRRGDTKVTSTHPEANSDGDRAQASPTAKRRLASTA